MMDSAPRSILAKLLEICPFTETMNLALTVNYYLEYLDKVGWNDKTLLQALLSLLKQHEQDLHTKLSIKKNDLFSFFKALTQVCHQTSKITTCRDYLSKPWPQYQHFETDNSVSGV